jgi:Zn-dependent protease with chaperone function
MLGLALVNDWQFPRACFVHLRGATAPPALPMRSLEAYRELIGRVEALAQAHPLRYRVNLALLAALGFGYVAALALLTLLAAIAALALVVLSKNVVLLKLVLLPLALAYVLVKAMWVRLPAPQGRRVTAREVPALFQEIERVRAATGAQRVHEVLLTPDFNAAVTQVPRLGVLGWPRRYLIIGLPLLASLPPYQFRAVLAHEFAHLAANHSRFGNWIYRIRQTWKRALEALEGSGSGAVRLFTWFFERYTPYFNAYSFVLARANEYEADRESARITSRDDAADALVAVYAKGSWVEAEFWKRFYARAEQQPQPPAQPFVEYLEGLRSIPPEAAQRALAAALSRSTGIEDTHPALADRLAALGAPARAPACFQLSAAHALLGAKRLQLMEEFDRAWRESLAGPWKERHASIQAMKERLTALEQAARERELDSGEQWELARAVEAVRGSAPALAVLDRLLQRAPEHAPALYARGRIRLEDGDASGTDDVERAMQLDEEAREPGAQLLYTWFYARHDLTRCDRYRGALIALQNERKLASIERAHLRRRDVLGAHGLDAPALAGCVEALRSERSVKRAWLVRKQVRYMTRVPAYVLCVEYRPFSRNDSARLLRLAHALDGVNSCLALADAGARRRLRRIEGALIFER